LCESDDTASPIYTNASGSFISILLHIIRIFFAMYSSPRTARSTHSKPISQKLRAASPEDLDGWNDAESDETLSEPQPEDVDEPWVYTFKVSYATATKCLY
jgi:hypothetical protein